ncbi:MAG: ABC transporter ATP-binding protein [Alphaproteobacteria bacterium]|nr:ABC transporter ATP-binding protein [Alphaproteobacteria bacterium]
MTDTILELKNIKRWFGDGDKRLNVLNGVNLKIAKGEIVALTGPSGSGKSTLLYQTGLLDTPSAGEIFLAGQPCAKMKEKERTMMRRKYLGFVYQSHLLLPDFTCLENVMMPLLIGGVDKKEAAERATELLETMGLKHRLKHRPGEMSGGEQQRAAIARALANKPTLLLADEPTGNLDPKTSEKVFNELLSTVRQTGLSALIATHNPQLAAKMDRRIHLENGILVEEK